MCIHYLCCYVAVVGLRGGTVVDFLKSVQQLVLKTVEGFCCACSPISFISDNGFLKIFISLAICFCGFSLFRTKPAFFVLSKELFC